MISNYFRTWLRNALRYRIYAIINLLGLGIGIACGYLCVLYILHDWSFDRFHRDYHRIYRVVLKARYKQSQSLGPLTGEWLESTNLPVALTSEATAEIPEIEITTRVLGAPHPRMATWHVGTHRGFLRATDEVLLVDESFLKIFSFPVISGTVHSSPNKVVLTREFARSLSNDINGLVGKVLWIRSPRQPDNTAVAVEIGGIVESPPSNSSLKFAVLLPFTLCSTFLGKKDGEWNWFFNATHYVRLPEELDEEAIERKLTQIVQKHPAPIWDLDSFKVRLQPITDLHHHGHRMSGVWKGLRPTTNPLYGYVLGGLSVLVLSASCLNYVLLYVARFNLRAKEFGLRQVLGANRNHLTHQLLVECLGYSILACGIGLVAAELASKPLEGILQIRFTSTADPIRTILILGAMACITGLATAIYPVALIPSVSAVSVLRKTSQGSRSGPFLKVLMAAQSGVTLILVFCAIVMFEQIYFMTTTDLGFEPTNLVRLDIKGLDGNEADRLQRSLSAYLPVTSCARTRQPIGWSNATTVKGDNGLLIDGVNYIQVDGPFLKTVGLKLLRGRSLHQNHIRGEVIVNESFQRHLMPSDPIGQALYPANKGSQVFGHDSSGRIVGVVKDFHFRSLRHIVPPTIITVADISGKRADTFREMLIRIREDSTDEFLAHLRGIWKELNLEQKPLSFSFVEDEVRKSCAKDVRWSKIVSGASLCAILIASMGTLGMTSLAVTRRRKEIAIRKAMGALPSRIASGIVLNYAVPGFAAAAITLPLSYFFMDQWLSSFPYRIQPGAGTALAVILLGVLLPLVGSFVHSMRVASESPSVALRED